MLRQRLLDALDSSSPLLFIEAIDGSGKSTVLSQWEDRGGGQGETRLRFDAQRLPSDPVALMRMFWSALRHRLRQDLPTLPAEDAQLEQALMEHLNALHRPVTLAIQSADHLSELIFEVMLRLLDAGVRLIIAGFDVTDLVGIAQQRALYHSTLGDRDVWLTLTETSLLVQESGLEADEEAVAAIYHATGGHPGMVAASLTAMPIESTTGVVTRDRVIATFLAEQPPAPSVSGFAEFLSVAIQLPRFTLCEATALTGGSNGARYLSRVLAMNLGRMVWHAGLQERVFRWDERTRLVFRQALHLSPAGETVRNSQVIAAARAAGDEELLISALVQAGELDEAEALLREQIWDLLPNAMAPLWASLERLSPLALLERPALLSARLRLSPHRSRSPVSVQAARSAGREMAEAAPTISPWARVGSLAYAIDFALYAGERERLIDLYSRARALISDLMASDAIASAGGREVSKLLLIADSVYRSGNTIPAAEIGGFAARLIELDPERLDPRGERLAFARRLILHDHRARGLQDGVDPEPLLAGPQFLWRDGDIVVAEMTLMWGALDDGEFNTADAHLRVAGARVADPEEWPILLLMRAHLALYRQSPAELEMFVSAFERSTLSEPGHFAQQPLSQIERMAAFLGKKVGRPIASPGYLPVAPEPGGPFYPRTEFVVHLMEALYALRAERLVEARTALAAALAVSLRRELGVYTLANAQEHEVRALQELAEEVPGGARLRIDRALLFAGNLHSPQTELSEREQEVLDHLREGATNRQMAQSLFVSANTVKFHRANLMRKLEATNRHEVLEAAARLGL